MAHSKVIVCRYCGNKAKMEVLASANINETWGDAQTGYGPDMGTSYDVLICPSCERNSIVSYFWQEDMNEEDIKYEYLFPAEQKYPSGLPEDILKQYTAANKIKPLNANAYAMLMRRLLETVCIKHDAKHDTLAKMLKELADRGDIPFNLVKVAQGLKNFGNVGAHAGGADLSEDEIELVSALSNALLEYFYTAPYLANLAEEKLDKLRQSKKL